MLVAPQVCWCTETQKAKQKAIDEGAARIESLSAEIEQGVALSARLQPEIDSLKKEAEKNKQALEQAAAIRKKQNGEFVAESGDLKDSVAAVKKAVNILKKKDAGPTSFLQVTSKASQVKSALQKMFSRSHRQGSSKRFFFFFRPSTSHGRNGSTYLLASR